MPDQIHGAGVHQAVLKRHIGIIGCNLLGDLAPHPRRIENVGLIDRGQQTASRARGLEAQPHDALHLRLGVGEGIHGLALAVFLPTSLGLAEVDAAGQLAQHDHIHRFDCLPLERRAVGQDRQHLDWADIGEQAQPLAQAENRLLRPNARLRVVPLGTADGAEQDGVLCSTHLERLSAQGCAVRVD